MRNRFKALAEYAVFALTVAAIAVVAGAAGSLPAVMWFQRGVCG